MHSFNNFVGLFVDILVSDEKMGDIQKMTNMFGEHRGLHPYCYQVTIFVLWRSSRRIDCDHWADGATSEEP